ncbi:hypothetical protein [Hirschia litorea]|uniref:Flagellar protein FliL n=1 Tax=Hirschia litorea TaxID=1199156 RepID=A0ABW2IGR0_9PROT
MAFSMPSISKTLALCAVGVVISTTSFGGTAYAAGDSANKKEEKEINRSVELNAMVFPVFDEDRKLVNYLYVNARMLVADGKGVWDFREKAHIVRDVVLRAAHRESIHLQGNYSRIDEEKAEKLFIETVNKELGEHAFTGMTFLQVASQELG